MKHLFVCILTCFSLSLMAQLDKGQRTFSALRITETIKIDGILDEAAWLKASKADNFIQHNPNPGVAPLEETEVQLLYDDEAIYVGAILHDNKIDSIATELTPRDGEGNHEKFSVVIDPYARSQTGFNFELTSAGVQIDELIFPNNSDRNWNAVWWSKVRIDRDAWYVEMKIPFSALRFPSEDIQEWNINFRRHLRRNRENSHWNFVDPAINGFLTQFGKIDGIENIKTPLRLSITPYVTAIAEYSSGADVDNGWGTSLAGGMDLKYGINDAFTLDMTLIPDFSQVQFDEQVLNLSPFEVFFDENRPFFVEGVELFDKAGIFYSRRVGGPVVSPIDVSEIEDAGGTILTNPGNGRLLNATKISGRNSNNLGIGFFNAVEGQAEATYENAEGELIVQKTNPYTNYNVLVLDQALKNNSSISLINTNVTRFGDFYDANVTGSEVNLLDKSNTWGVSASGAYSQKLYTDEDNVLGHTFRINAGKRSGNFQPEIWYGEESDEYDPNDLGFLFNNNSRWMGGGASYNIYEPFGLWNRMFNRININYNTLFDISKRDNFNINGNTTMILKTFHAYGMWARISPLGTNDWFESRRSGWVYKIPTDRTIDFWVSSDYRKTIALDAGYTRTTWDEKDFDRYTNRFRFSPRLRVSNQLKFIYQWDLSFNHNNVGWVADLDNDDIILGRRDRTTLTNGLEAAYIFTNKMALNTRIRHYWSKAFYNDYHKLGEDGYLMNTDYDGWDAENNESLHNVNFNALTMDMVFKWQFSPGSETSIVWKTALFNNGSEPEENYFRNWDTMLNEPMTNNFSIRVLYYLDYLMAKKAIG